MSASDGQDSNGNTDLILSGLTKIFSGTCKTAAGLGGVAVGSFASGVLVADNATGVLTFDDAALFITVPFTAASGKYAFNGSREAVDGLTDLTVGVVGTARTLGTWIGDKAKSAWDNLSTSRTDTLTQSKTNNDHYKITIQIQGPSITQNRRNGASHGSHIKNLVGNRPITYAEAKAGLNILEERLSPRQKEKFKIQIEQASAFMKKAAASGGVGPGAHSFQERNGNGDRVDILIFGQRNIVN